MSNKDTFIAYRAIEDQFRAAKSKFEGLQARIKGIEFGIAWADNFKSAPDYEFLQQRVSQFRVNYDPIWLANNPWVGSDLHKNGESYVWANAYEQQPAETMRRYQALRTEYDAAKSEFERLVSEKAAAWKEFQRQKVTLTVSQLAAIADVDVSYVRAEIANGRLMAKKLDEDQPNSPHVISGFDALGWLDKPRRGSRRKAN